jgi:hypothetical protein
MSEDSYSWVTDAQQQWRSNNLPKVVEILSKQYQPPPVTVPTKPGPSASKKDISASAAQAEADGSDELDVAFIHNWALSNFVNSGTIVQLPTSLTSRKLNAEEAKEKSAKAGTALDPSTYTPHSIEWTLATIGLHNCLGYYNLAIYQFVVGALKSASETCEQVIDKCLSMLEDAIAIKLALLFLFMQLKLNNLQNPKVAQMITWLEKFVPSKIDELSKTESPAGMCMSNLRNNFIRPI